MSIRYIVMIDIPYEGLHANAGWDEDDPMPSFATKEEATEYAKSQGMISPKGRRNDAEILTVSVP